MNRFLKYLPESISIPIASLGDEVLGAITELRLREGLPFSLSFGASQAFLSQNGLTNSVFGAKICTAAELEGCLERLLDGSLYSFEETMKNGYIPLPDGARAGVCGEFLFTRGEGRLIRTSSINIRISKLRREFGAKLCDHYKSHGLFDTLIVSPPAFGKTTLLKSVITLLSEGELGVPIKVGVVDSRKELFVPRMTRGTVDVLASCPKGFGISLLTRTMSPEVIVCDEVTAEELPSVLDARKSGVVFICSCHARSVDEALLKPYLRRLIEDGGFFVFVVIKSGYEYEINTFERGSRFGD